MGFFSEKTTKLLGSSTLASLVLNVRQCLSDHRFVLLPSIFSSISSCSGVRPIRFFKRSRTRMGTNDTTVRAASFTTTLGERKMKVKVPELAVTVVDATVCKMSPTYSKVLINSFFNFIFSRRHHPPGL